MSAPRVVLFGDPYGLPMTLRHLPGGAAVAVVAAALRPGQHDAVREIAGRTGVPVLLQPERGSPAYAAFVEALAAVRPDFIIVNSHSMKLHPEVVALPRAAAVNVHGALLPRYRGANPIQWALIDGETETGVTMHHVTDVIDGGDIVAQRRVPILFEDTWREVQARIGAAADELLAVEIPRLLRGESARVPQDESRATACRRRGPEDGEIDWTRRVIDIYNLVRALVSPLPGAFCRAEGRKIVFDAYLAIPEVCALKYGLGGKRLAAGPIALVSDGADRTGTRNDGVAFRVLVADRPAGVCRLAEIDWDRRAAVMEIRLEGAPGGPDAANVAGLLREFAGAELGLRDVLPRAPAGGRP